MKLKGVCVCYEGLKIQDGTIEDNNVSDYLIDSPCLLVNKRQCQTVLFKSCAFILYTCNLFYVFTLSRGKKGGKKPKRQVI